MTVLGKLRATRVALAIGLTVGIAGAYVAISAGDEPSPSPVQSLAAHEATGGMRALAFGLEPSRATTAFTLDTGVTVSDVFGASGGCIFWSREGTSAEQCETATGIAEGKTISVADECTEGGHHRMEITGLAPADAASVRLGISDGGERSTAVEDGAFRFEGTNPAAGEPYPTQVTWVRSDGQQAGTAPLPVQGDAFCLAPPE